MMPHSPAQLLPHRPPMLLVEEVEEATDDGVACLGRVPDDHPYAAGGVAPVVLGIEVCAQAAAVWAGLRARASDPEGAAVAEGYLTTLREVSFAEHELPAGVALRARVTLDSRMGPLAVYRARLERADDGGLVLEGTLSTFEKRVS
jgi:predicted hotdog family 3-hydroxylacyl-ACP dehydratase